MWAKFINIILGLWLIVAPSILGYTTAASDNGHIVGPIIITFSTISLWEATDNVRKWNYPFGLWLLLSPFVLGYELPFAIASDIGVGIAGLVLSSINITFKNRYGGGWSSLWKKNPDHSKEEFN